MKKQNIDDLAGKIISCAKKVHKTLGSGFDENIYQRSFAIELTSAGLNFVKEKEMQIFYRGSLIGSRKADFYVEDAVIVELKAVDKLESIHKTKAVNYFEACNITNGLLINFGKSDLEFKRIYNRYINRMMKF